MTTLAFAVGLSEDAGERSGLALSRQQLVEHLREDHPFRIAFARDNHLLRVGGEEYADAVGDLLHGLGAAVRPTSTKIGMGEITIAAGFPANSCRAGPRRSPPGSRLQSRRE